MITRRRAMKVAVPTAVAGIFAALLVFVGSSSASAHGYISGNGVVARAAMTANTNRGSVEYEPWSLEAPKGFPASGPADGQIASAGGKFGGNLDAQTSTRWVKNSVNPGPLQINWTFTAPHATTKWHYYLTKQGWNQNAPLARSSFELIETVMHDGSAASNNPSHTVTIPSNRTGYHVLLAVWDIADTGNAFYNVVDLNVGGTAPPADTEAPSVPTGLNASAASTSASLSWSASTDNAGVSGYDVYRNGTRIATTAATNFADTGLTPGTTYSYRVRALDGAGNASAQSSAVSVTTLPSSGPDTSAPTIPTGLHSMGATSSSVPLMWSASSDNVGVTGYDVYRNGSLIASTPDPYYTDTTVAASTAYTYQVSAKDAAGNKSGKGNTVSITTPGSGSGGDTTKPSVPGSLRTTATSASSVSLAWNAASDDVAVVRYDVYRAIGSASLTKIGSTTMSTTMFTDPNVMEKTEYRYRVRAYDAAGNYSSSSILTVTTPSASSVRVWSAFGSYVKGETVTHLGNTYRCLQNYKGEGDPNWIYAPSLWVRL